MTRFYYHIAAVVLLLVHLHLVMRIFLSFYSHSSLDSIFFMLQHKTLNSCTLPVHNADIEGVFQNLRNIQSHELIFHYL